jgi:hypothetical protein
LELLANTNTRSHAPAAIQQTTPTSVEHAFLFEDEPPVPRALSNDDVSAASQLLQQLELGSSLLELRNHDEENVYDLLTRSSVTVHISHSFSGGEHTTDDDIVDHCNVPSHQDEAREGVVGNALSAEHQEYKVDCDEYPFLPDIALTTHMASSGSGSGSDSVSGRERVYSTSSAGIYPPPTALSATLGGSQLCTRSLLKRLVLQAHPGFNRPLLHELNYRARRMALFLGFCAGTISTATKKREVNIFAKLRRIGHGELFVMVISCL